jgi:hypothetical protein
MFHRNWWRWARANKIRRETLLVLLALEGGPWGSGHHTGLFHISVGEIAEYTGLNIKEVLQSIRTLERINHVVYDVDYQVVFVRGMLSRQCPNFNSSENTLQGVANHVFRMPETSRATREFIISQRNEPELYELLEGYIEGDPEGDTEGYSEKTGDLDTGDHETGDHESVIAGKDPALTPSVQPSSSSPPSTPGKAKSKAECSGKGKATPGNGKSLSSARMKTKGLRIAAKKFDCLEWDLARISQELRNTYGFTSEEINSKEVRDALGIFNGEMKAAN